MVDGMEESPMNPEMLSRIEKRAHALWEAEGQPHGRHEEHWRRAAREIETEEAAGAAAHRRPPHGARRGTTNPNRRPTPRRKKHGSA